MEILIPIAFLIAFVFIMRMFGAWMLRIDEVIKLQKDILNELRLRNLSDRK
jgi:hypothetical protein